MSKEVTYSKIPEGYYMKKLGGGKMGTCYLTEDGKVYKEFYKKYYFFNKLKTLSYYESDLIAFPEELVFLEANTARDLKGYLMQYVDGDKLINIEDAVRFKEFVTALDTFEREMFRLSRQGILFNDLNQENLIWTIDGKLKAVDTDLYDPTQDDEFGNAGKENIKELAETIIGQFRLGTNFKNQELNEAVLKCGAYGRMRCSSLLEKFAEEGEKEQNKSIETIGDFNDSITLLKK